MLYIHAWADTCRKRNEGPAVRCLPTFQVSSDIVGSSKSCLELYNYTTLAKKILVTPSESEHLWTLWNAVFISSLGMKLCSQHACVHEACLDFTGHERLALSESIQPLCQENQRRVCMWPYNVAPSTHPALSSACINHIKFILPFPFSKVLKYNIRQGKVNYTTYLRGVHCPKAFRHERTVQSQLEEKVNRN